MQSSSTYAVRSKHKVRGYAWSTHLVHDDRLDSTQSQGLLQSLIAKIINNVQVTVKNVHIRYEDNLSVPGVSSS